jgi:uncharacterized protein (DUF433 family)
MASSEAKAVEDRELKAYKNYRWIVADRELLDGKLAVRGTRFSVSFILSLLAEGLSLDRIEDIYGTSVREAVPEALRAAADAVDVPSPAALTPAERAAELRIPGLDKLIAWFGFFPSFHDAEVTSMSLDRSGPSRITVHTWAMTDQVSDGGAYVCQKHVMVTFVLEGIKDISLEGFNRQNVLNGISLDRTSEGYQLVLEGIYGVDGKIEAELVSIEFEPGTPSQSLPAQHSAGIS